MDAFVLCSGALNIFGTFLLGYLAVGSYREGRKLRRIQLEVAELMNEVHDLQSEMRVDQRSAQSEILETKETVERVAQAAQRRRLPRLRLDFGTAD
jgi:hypothetical protein